MASILKICGSHLPSCLSFPSWVVTTLVFCDNHSFAFLYDFIIFVPLPNRLLGLVLENSLASTNLATPGQSDSADTGWEARRRRVSRGLAWLQVLRGCTGASPGEDGGQPGASWETEVFLPLGHCHGHSAKNWTSGRTVVRALSSFCFFIVAK